MKYTKINKEDRDAVVWLQLALDRVMPGPGSIHHVGILGPATQKSIRLYQAWRKLPVTGVADETTLRQINQELQERGLTI